MNCLYADSITKSYDGHPLLTDIHIRCSQSEIIGLLGRNGCGKSTMLKIIFGSLRADYRFVKVNDKQLCGIYDGAGLVKYLPQDSFLPNNMQVCNAMNLLCSTSQISAFAHHPLIKPLLGSKVGELSGGTKRLFETMLIIHSDAMFALLDEPFSGLSPLHAEHIKRAIIDQTPHKGFIITDHSYRNVLQIATRTMLIHEGAIHEMESDRDLTRWGYVKD